MRTPRYLVVDYSQSASSLFSYTVVDSARPTLETRSGYDAVCECFDEKDARLVCDALSARVEPRERWVDCPTACMWCGAKLKVRTVVPFEVVHAIPACSQMSEPMSAEALRLVALASFVLVLGEAKPAAESGEVSS